MSSRIAVRVNNVSKSFKLPHEKQSSLKGALINFNKRGYEKQHVLKEIDFEIKEGEFFGIVGRNGSGKSTLLKLLAGIYDPDQGAITINGKLTPFIELGVGFNPELSGRENVFLNGALLGFNRKEMISMYDEIVEFAELSRFMDQKLKNYSSGMQVRLAFSIAIRAQGDILLLDEVLAVGDVAFQKKCYDYFKQLKRDKKTVVFVSHDAGVLQEYCTNGVLIEKGKIVVKGSIGDVVKQYTNVINDGEKKEVVNKESKRWGTQAVIIESIKDANKSSMYRDGNDLQFAVVFKAKQLVPPPVFGITITDMVGQVVFQSNTLWCEIESKEMAVGKSVTCRWVIPNVFNTGSYLLSPAVSDESGTVVYDWREDLLKFKVDKRQKSHGIINVSHQLSVK